MAQRRFPNPIPKYWSLEIGESTLLSSEMLAVVACRWAYRHGQKFSRQFAGDGKYIVVRLK